MQFLTLYTPDNTGAPEPDKMAEMGKFIEESFRSGQLVSTGGLQERSLRVRSTRGQISVLDGPYAESKEVVAGYAILEAASEEEAIAMTRRFLAIAGDGESEVRRIFGPEDAACTGPQSSSTDRRTVA